MLGIDLHSKESSGYMRISLRTLMLMVTALCLIFGCTVIVARSVSTRMSVANEARVFSKYLWQQNGDFDLACTAIKNEPPKIGSDFVKHWNPVSPSETTKSSVVAYRTKSLGGRTYVILNDYRISFQNTDEWMEGREMSAEREQKTKTNSGANSGGRSSGDSDGLK